MDPVVMSDRTNEESGSPEVSVDARNAAFPCAIFRRCFSSSASLLFQPRPAGLPEDARRGSSVDTLAPSTDSAACSTRRSSRYPSVRPLSSLASPRRATPSPTRARRSLAPPRPRLSRKNISNFRELTAALLFPIPQIAPRDDDDTERHKTNADATTADDVHGGGGGGGGKQPKKPRLVWTPELHMRFMNAVNHLGIKNAVPKTILQLMNVEGMTRENVASHLQKYRLYLKRLAGVPPSAPLPADIMQRVHPFQYPGTATASAAAMHAAAGGGAPSFAPTIEQMHAGVPPGTTLTTFPPNAGPSPTDGFDAEALHAQMAATAQFMSYMGAAGAAGGFGPPPGAVGNAGAPGGSEEAAMNAAAMNAAAMMRQGYSAGYPAMPYGSPPMPAGFMPPPWMVPGAPSLGSGSFHDDPSSRRA